MATDSNERHTRLQKLGGSDYEIAEGQPDIRGWDVKDDSGRQIGEVEELIFDVQSRKVRYIVLDLDDNELDLDDREVLVPIGIAQLHEEDDDVLLPGITAEQLRALPEYDEDRFDMDSEESVRNVFGGLGAGAIAGGSDADFYNHDHFNEDNLYRNRQRGDIEDSEDSNTIPVVKEEANTPKRETAIDGVSLFSRLVDEPVLENINLRKEQENMDRLAVDRLATEGDLREEDIEMLDRNKLPAANKQARVVEEISLNKEVSERDENIGDTARNTEVDIDRDEDKIRRDGERSDD
jgi:stress response protein YsnF